MMIEVHDDAVDDIEGISQINMSDSLKLVSFIEQLCTDQRLIAKLLENGFGENRQGPISVKKWGSVHKLEHLPVWRLRAWDLEKQGLNYRLIYFFNWMDRNYYIMAVVHRSDLDYDDKYNEIRIRVTKRIQNEFPGI
ncbi:MULTISPECIES: hypothetical protein [Methylomonas]|uniref:Uncharacterized protein n=1 Tax=Methylomonas koyamae TaxID=702114 RepID=A0A177NLJ8_9GAMM|nr:hypothetical protein [Methylomonas koyamae]OAI18273.1 hypothetical protein A1355_05965 [Methylomonas koyamae]